MEKILEQLLNSISSLPEGLRVLMLSLLMLTFTFYQIIRRQYARNFFLKLLKKNSDKIKISDLTQHLLFNNQFVLKNMIDSLSFENEQKTKVFRTILLTEVSLVIKNAKLLKESVDYNDADAHTLCNKMINSVIDIQIKHDLGIKEFFVKEYGENKTSQLINYTMNAEFGYRYYRSKGFERVILYINHYIRESKIFDNQMERVDAYLYELYFLLEMAIKDTALVFNNFNGEFNK